MRQTFYSIFLFVVFLFFKGPKTLFAVDIMFNSFPFGKEKTTDMKMTDFSFVWQQPSTP